MNSEILAATTFSFARKTGWALAYPKIIWLVSAILIFFAFIYLIFFLAEKSPVKMQDKLKYLVFLVPALLFLFIGLVAPTIRTFYLSFFDARSKNFIGIENYIWAFTQPEIQIVLKNTLIWVVATPIGSTIFGLALAVLTDKMKRSSIPKSLIFMPMAISFVGASIIWKFVYEPARLNDSQIGILSQIWISLGFTPPNWLLTIPLNTFLLIIVMIWIQTGFAMVVLSAAIKAIPEDVLEAAMLDGAYGWKQFIKVTVPMIRTTLVVVLATITIATLKVFDIVRTMTGGNFQTSLIANEMYQQSFRALNYGTGSALAVILFLGVLPLVVYNVRQLQLEKSVR